MKNGQFSHDVGEQVRWIFLNSITIFNADKVLMLPLSIFNMAGFSLSCSNNPLINCPPVVMSK